MKVIGEFSKQIQKTSAPLILANDEAFPHSKRILISSSFDETGENQNISDEGKLRILAAVPLLEFEIFLEKEESQVEICQASIQLLNSSSVDGKYFGLLSVTVRRRVDSTYDNFLFNGYIYLLESSCDTLEQSTIVETVKIAEPQANELHFHLLPAQEQAAEHAEFSLSALDDPQIFAFNNQLISLSLGECITIHQIKTTLLSESKAKVEIIQSIRISKLFWWAEWCPRHQFLAFAHRQKRTHSLYLEEEMDGEAVTPSILSVFQFHSQCQRETVLNFPLEGSILDESKDVKSPMISSPLVLSSDTYVARSIRLLTHPTGNVCLFYLKNPGESFLLCYNLTILHHNKTLTVDVPHGTFGGNGVKSDPLKVDVCLVLQGQYVVVLAWPYFVHLLDIGIEHEPSHHIVLPLNILFPELIKRNSQFQLFCPRLTNEDSALQLLFNDLRVQTLELNSSFLVSVLRKSTAVQNSDVNLVLAIIHALLLHLNSLHSAKSLIGEMSKRAANLQLAKVFQEFIVAFARSAVVKDIVPNMEDILHFIPYCPTSPLNGADQQRYYQGKTYTMKLEISSAKVSTMLLSPSQRIFTHRITDIWTSLWEVNTLLLNSHRFCHKTIADKLLLSLQCYKPEALSRASTPMSPSSPMVCGSLGDVVSMFGRRNHDLQLPFVEHESCTANKQEYIFSINLRELSMHLLKERKDWPLACHTVAGKYVNALSDASRLLCHLISVSTISQLQRPLRPKDKGFTLIDTLSAERQLTLFLLMEHYALAHGTLACPLPQGFTPFFAYLGYRVLRFEQFLWHVRCGTFDLQIDMVKTIMADLSDADDKEVEKKLQLILFLPKSRACRVLNGWSHPIAIGLRAKQHASELLCGAVSSLPRKSHFSAQVNRVKTKTNSGPEGHSKEHLQGSSALDTFFRLLTAKANPADIDLGLLTEATMLSMK